MDERKNGVTMKGQPLTLVGNDPKIGAPAPDFEVVDADLKPVKFSSFKGKPALILSVPSIDTSVCSRETKTFNDSLKSFGDLNVLVISMDLPFAQKRFCMAEKIHNLKVFSDYQRRDFGQNYGVLIKEIALLARAAFFIDEKGILQYRYLVSEVTEEPPYEKIIDEVKKGLKLNR